MAAGLQVGDLIQAVDGHAVDTPRSAQTYVMEHKPGDVLTFDVQRQMPSGYRESQIKVTLGSSGGGRPARSGNPGSQPVATKGTAGSAAPPQSAAAPEGNIRYRRYVDPAEQAFEDMVPEGWRVGGRLVRYGPVSIAPFVQAIRPDGAIFVQLGDWHIQDFSDIPGWKEGTVYTPGTSINLVRRVQNSGGYARSYGLNFEKWLGCEKSDFVNSESAATPGGLATVPQSHVETSVAHFTCMRGGQQYVGRSRDDHR
jgi:PDZ domain-containing protein